MYLQNIRLQNFRPYRGAEFDFNDTDGHIQIVEGPQGAGKSSLQKAIQWGLYGDTATVNYRENWNRDARDSGDERMSVGLTFFSEGSEYNLDRSIRRFSHGRERAVEEIELSINQEDVKTGEDAQEIVNRLLPETLKDFFFLDGEEIQRYLEGKTSDKVVKEIEKVLNHQPILNAEEDLNDKLDQYRKNRNELETDISDRDSLTKEIQKLRNDKQDREEELNELQEKADEFDDELDSLREKAKERDEEIIDEIDDVDKKLSDLQAKRSEFLNDLQETTAKLHLLEINQQLRKNREELEGEISEINEMLEETRKHSLIHDLIEEAKHDTCPICGNSDFQSSQIPRDPPISEGDINELESRKATLNEMHRRLEQVSVPEKRPHQFQDEIKEIRQEIEELEQYRSSLIAELSGSYGPEEYAKISEAIEEVENTLREIKIDIGDLQEDIRGLTREISEKERQRDEKAEYEELERLEEKIDTAEMAIDRFEQVRALHKRQKQDDIEQAMASVFDQVAKSEFVSSKYETIAFKGEVGDEDAFAIELVREDGRSKDMENHPPSAGESQLAALSFVFGLNRYAAFNATVVFDTVAGRLDSLNAKAEGEFFSTLLDPLILLVTDAELELLKDPLQDDIGAHYKLRLDKQMNTKPVQVQ